MSIFTCVESLNQFQKNACGITQWLWKIAQAKDFHITSLRSAGISQESTQAVVSEYL